LGAVNIIPRVAVAISRSAKVDLKLLPSKVRVDPETVVISNLAPPVFIILSLLKN
jgi:hypothetical protein